jgi:hypothetical protein
MALRYKFVEVSPVTDETLERAVNEWVPRGWTLDTIHFVLRESSHRPALAFVRMLRDQDDDTEPEP